MKNYSYSKYPKRIAYAETSSPRQVKKIRSKNGDDFYELTEAERKQLKRSQFAFGTIYPYTFDGLTYIATHHKELSKEYDKEIIKASGDYHYQVELPFTDFVYYCLLSWTGSREYLKHELRMSVIGLKTDEYKFFRCIPIAKNKYISTQPLIVSFLYKPQSEMTELEIQRLKRINRFNQDTQIGQNIVIHIIKPFLNPILHKDIGHGWFSIPSAFQAKIDHSLDINPNIKLNSLFLRKYYLYLNTLDCSTDKTHMIIDAVDLWEHVSPSQVNLVNGKYKCINNWQEAKAKLKSAHNFFQEMKKSGVISGSKLYPAIDTNFPEGILAYQKTQPYPICYTRSLNSKFVPKNLKFPQK
ncbi:hypothetical protein ATZ36_13660 [Candidatus Endomicrobiellum trichonymphae]|uniref:Uncharacterized protein n=1 Tax=Endomicrobium trichonymphae TaxID=1408204 RepID=A0A1E5INT0_ENDTX|nr:hypothetical protein ATZ36_13660 [Candidatus Endomicrobium trichonymphae]